MKKLFNVIFLLLPTFVNAQIITTWAGGGDSLGSNGVGDGLHAKCATITDPSQEIFDQEGNLYVSSALGGNRIRKIDVNGVITTFAGTGMAGDDGDNGLATNAKLNIPQGITFDKSENLYIAESQNGTIRKVDKATGIITTIAGIGVLGFSGDNGLATQAMLNVPGDVCFDKKGNLYIADEQNNRVRKLDIFGIITTFAGTGNYGYSGDGGQATNAKLWLPWGLACDGVGNIYISEAGSYHIRKVDTNGIITTFAGNGSSIYIGDNTPAINTAFSPGKIRFDNKNNLFIACFDNNNNNRVLEIDQTGVVHNIAGNGSTGFSGDGGLAINASIYYPGGLAFDKCNNLYVTDVDNKRVRKVTFDTTCNRINTECTTNANTIINRNEIKIYPNPTTDALHIEMSTSAYYKLTNIVGAMMQKGQLKVGSNNINVATLPGGIYVLEIGNEQQKIVRKIVKQ